MFLYIKYIKYGHFLFQKKKVSYLRSSKEVACTLLLSDFSLKVALIWLASLAKVLCNENWNIYHIIKMSFSIISALVIVLLFCERNIKVFFSILYRLI